MSEARFSFEDAIREFVYIELPGDEDKDGRNDLIRADIIRPRELDGTAKIPVIMDASPYYELYDRHGEKIVYAHPEDPWNSPLVRFPFLYDNYFVPRGYAVVLLSTAGTSRSAGFCDIGGPQDVASANAVVDWVNGRLKGYSTRDVRSPQSEMKADWASGLVGAIGKSYDGSVANGMAATGVEGLRTIVPISAISSQYDWYHPQGALLDGDDADGGWFEPDNFAVTLQTAAEGRLQRFNSHGGWQRLHDGADKLHRSYNEFWRERDYRSHVKDFKASVFLVHGTHDLNVMMNQVSGYWKALGQADVPRKMWLHQYGHDDPFDVRNVVWLKTLERWFDYWLKGIDNGIMDEPQVCVEDDNGNWQNYASWPVPGTRIRKFGVRSGVGDARLGTLNVLNDADADVVADVGTDTSAEGQANNAGGAKTEFGTVFGLVAEDATGAKTSTNSFANVSADAQNDISDTPKPLHIATIKGGRIPELVPFSQSDKPNDKRLLYVSEPLPYDCHVSGTPYISLRIKSTAGDTNLCASLIEYGEGNYVQVSRDLSALVPLEEKREAVGSQSADDKSVYPVCVPRKSREMENMVTRGWIATAHKDSFESFEPTPVGQFYEIGFDLLATDWTIRARHRLALAIYNNSCRLAEVSSCDFDVDLDSIRLEVPMVIGH
ncbi:CocE/NonD family hydrolase [Bifidobacterium sp. ESL0745]|uniref:CocE/NonD family hydrolase n=1 Tax=Bifidobacterium sp. ESL0745 TaxID=2983226 RepID=UPI0023F89715|nr:CocE/NonD family hydrolase [Bifidobacterium sp. ESL0745]MDF7665285.1 CocE/NonD family hydrolase [Bifidobacterium sp. ESL0745]